MNETQLREILVHLDAVLAVYRKQEGKLTAVELSLKSLTTTLHSQIEMEINNLTRGIWR